MVSIWITLLSLDSDSAFPMALEMKGTLRGVVIIVMSIILIVADIVKPITLF